MGAGASKDQETARAEMMQHMPEVQKMLGDAAPRLKLKLQFTEIDLELAANVLEANGYRVTRPK